MSEVREEYTAETYPSFGKKYNDEKAIISLTSWKARINTVSKTLYSLLTQCPGFHIVLVLSEEEFPKMMDELPENLKLFVDNELIEVLWVFRNYKSFKKVLFTMDKYRDVPVISADDDCLYRFNYAQLLYNKWFHSNKKQPVTFWCSRYKNTNYFNTAGYATLHPPFIYGNCIYLLSNKIVNYNQDDDFYYAIRIFKKITGCINLNKTYETVVRIHDELSPLHNIYRKHKRNVVSIFLNEIKKNYDYNK